MKRLLIILIVTVVLIGAGWAFFTLGGTQSTPSPAAQEIATTQDTRFAKGDPDAPVKIVEYSDVLCPHCAQFNAESMPQIQANYIDTGKVYYEMRLVGVITPDSTRAAEGAYCAADLGKFWEYMETSYADTWNHYYRNNKSPSDIPYFREGQIATRAHKAGIESGVDSMKWQQCINSGTYQEKIAKNKADMEKIHAYGTPHFTINGKNYNGSPPYDVFKKAIEMALKEKAAQSKS